MPLRREQHGEEWARDSFPSVFASDAWQRTELLLQQFGAGGIFAVSCLPVVLHPVIAMGVMVSPRPSPQPRKPTSWPRCRSQAKIPMPVLIGALLGGRCVKYLVMAWCAKAAPTMLRFFGVPLDKLAAIASSSPSPSHQKSEAETQQRGVGRWL